MNTRSRRFVSVSLVSSFLVLGAVCAVPRAFAEPSPQGIGTWEGSGVASDAQSGAELGPFTITLVRKTAGPGKTRADGAVKTGDGRTITFWQESEERPSRGFKIVSSNGTGGGRCFANGLCQSYEQRTDGHAFATTIAKDGDGKLRVLVTELEAGKAVRFYDQTLLKKN
jgi:hypothetical protein